MTKKPFIIIPAILILHSITLSLYSLYSGPFRYTARGFWALWPDMFTLLAAILLAKKIKAKYWGLSIVALALATFPRTLIDTIPSLTRLLVATTLVLDAISALALLAASRYDTFDFSLWERGQQGSRISYRLTMIILLALIVGIFLYYARQ